MKQTSLNLLTRDGAVGVVFCPALTPEQYSELYELACYVHTAGEMKATVQQAAAKCGLSVEIDLPLVSG